MWNSDSSTHLLPGKTIQGAAALLAQPDASAELVLPYGSTMIGVAALHASNPVGQGDASMRLSLNLVCLRVKYHLTV